jgi:hypothetical protein
MIKDSKKSSFLHNNHKLFKIPKNVSLIFFTNLGTYLGSYQCELERHLINSSYYDAKLTFNIKTSINDNSIESSHKVKYKKNKFYNIEYIRYNGDKKCPNLILDLNDPILKHSDDEIFVHINKTGLFKYPLDKKNFYVNDCSLDKKQSYGISTINPFLTNRMIKILKQNLDEIEANIKILKKKYLDDFNDLSNEELRFKKKAIDTIEPSLEGLKKNYTRINLIKQSKEDSLSVYEIKTLEELCDYVSKLNANGKI